MKQIIVSVSLLLLTSICFGNDNVTATEKLKNNTDQALATFETGEYLMAGHAYATLSLLKASELSIDDLKQFNDLLGRFRIYYQKQAAFEQAALDLMLDMREEKN